MKKKVLSFLFVILFACFLTSCGDTNKGKLDKVTGLTVSKDGLVEWTKVENATSYDVVLMLEDEKTTSNTTECKYQLKELKNDYEISVIAKADKYENSDESDKVKYVGLNSQEQTKYYESLVNGSIGEKNPDASEKEKAQYDEIAALYEVSARKAIKAGYDAEAGTTLVNALQNVSSQDEAFSVIAMTLTTATPKEVESILYYVEVYALGSLVALRYSLEEQIEAATDPVFISDAKQEVVIINKALETFKENDVEFAKHLSNIVNTTVKAYKSLAVSFIPKMMQIIEDVQNNSLDAHLIYEAKTALVKALKDNMYDPFDFTFVLNVVGTLGKDVAKLAFDGIMQQAPEEVKPLIEKVMELVENAGDIDFTPVFTTVNQLYVSLLDTIESISEEYIASVVAQNSYEKMITFVVVDILQSAVTTPVQVEDATIVEFVDTINDLLNYLFGSEEIEVTIESLTGLTNEDVVSLLRTIFDAAYTVDGKLGEWVKSKEFKDAILSLWDVEIIDSSVSGNSFGVPTEDEMLVKVANGATLEENKTYYLFDIYETENNSWVFYKLTVTTHDFVTDSTGVTEGLAYDYVEETHEFANFSELIVVIEKLGEVVSSSKEELANVIAKICELAGKLTCFEDVTGNETIDQVKAIIVLLKEVKKESVVRALDAVVALIDLVVNYAKTVNVDEVIAKIASGEMDQIMSVLTDMITEDNVDVVYGIVENVSYLAEDLQLHTLLGASTREEFVTMVKTLIDNTFGFGTEDPIE